jgi:fructokinase
MRIGIDLGGTKIEAIALAEASGGAAEVLFRRRVPTPAGDYEGILNAVAGLVEAAERETGQNGTVGIATPGALSPVTGLLKNSNSTVLNGTPLDRDLASRLHRPVRMENDANCFALSEAVDGSAAGFEVVFGVILGTGVGGGIVIHRNVQLGRNRIAGEWGHNPMPWPRPEELPGPACYCGKRGCIETFLSGPGLAHEYRVQGGEEKPAAAIAEAAAAGEAMARACLDLYCDRLARGLASIVNVLDPDAIVLGGGLSNVASLYEKVPELLSAYTFSACLGTPILRASYGDSSGVRGAAWLWPDGGMAER